mmetsp:Transcript_8977/g.14932  ORF Transcript_8977/g.14932 Transcript_8977/m.14932 type:complete len:331 (+) Transcript_8977:91-1083(+)
MAESAESAPASKGGDGDGDEVEDTSEKYQDTSVTMLDLRKHDANWEQWQLRGDMKARCQFLISSQVPYFKEKPYIDYERDDIAEYTLKFLAQPQGYGWSLDFDPNFFCELAYEGFLSTGVELPFSEPPLQILLPWIDPKRNSLDFLETHVSHQVRKRAKRYTMTVDTAFDEVMLGCIWQHGEGWLYRGVRWLLRTLFQRGYTGSQDIHVGVHSFELWDSEGQLVAGDLGYTVGGVYTSMTGFRRQHTQGAGDVQLVLTAALLRKMGYDWWDLGMVMKYKAKLGARVITREAFIERLKRDRDKHTAFRHERAHGHELLQHLLQAQRAKQSI